MRLQVEMLLTAGAELTVQPLGGTSKSLVAVTACQRVGVGEVAVLRNRFLDSEDRLKRLIVHLNQVRCRAAVLDGAANH